MTRLLVYIGILIAAGAVYFSVAGSPGTPVPAPDSTPTTTPHGGGEAQMRTYSSAEYGISFEYPDSYTLTEVDSPGSAQREHHAIVLQRTEDLPAPAGGEGPPSITIDIYQNDLDDQTTESWIRGSSASNFKLGPMTLASTTIDGKAALSYRWSGLYEGTTVAIARPDWIYAFNVMYLQMGDDIVQDFVALRESAQLR